jgi:hypothetical protein
MTHQHDETVTITSARSSRSADIKRRQIKYLVSMGIRTVCVVGAVVCPSPWRWILVAGAVFLPYFAVVAANVSDGRDEPAPPEFVPEQHVQITSGSNPTPADDHHVNNPRVG